jgi:hypothetical protein
MLCPPVLHDVLQLGAGQPDVSDWNNALKLGFDPSTEVYPDWLSSQVRGGHHKRVLT